MATSPGPHPEPVEGRGHPLDHVRFWIFDLDNTLYPRDCGFMPLIEQRMTEYVQRETGLDRDAAFVLQKRLLADYGTTLAGMVAERGADPYRFLDEVHAVDHACLTPDPALRRALGRLPGKRLVFTNGPASHAYRVLDSLNLRDQFDDVFHLEAFDLVPKPNQSAYDALIRVHAVEPRRAAFFEDSVRNLEPAAALGMVTVLIAPDTAQPPPTFVHHRISDLTAFLDSLVLREAA